MTSETLQTLKRRLSRAVAQFRLEHITRDDLRALVESAVAAALRDGARAADVRRAGIELRREKN